MFPHHFVYFFFFFYDRITYTFLCALKSSLNFALQDVCFLEVKLYLLQRILITKHLNGGQDLQIKLMYRYVTCYVTH